MVLHSLILIVSLYPPLSLTCSSQLDMRRWLDDLNAAISRAPRYSELSAQSLQQPIITSSGESHYPNTLSHVCWYRNQSVSLADHLTMMEVSGQGLPNPIPGRGKCQYRYSTHYPECLGPRVFRIRGLSVIWISIP
ncbi:hypothetical protein XENTR_v10014725 [Xenopus tropicalis]|nr:hypothetical protein XENTR_v10014725 [Xenopus tropicalis]